MWSRPRESFVKTNWDAVVDKEGKKVGLRVVIRNEEGEIMAAVGEHRSLVSDPTAAKGYALRKAMEFCKDLNFSRVVFEGDAQVIVNVVNEEEKYLSIYGFVIEDAKKLLKGISQWSVKFVYRNANEAAHCLAKEALSLFSENVWIEEVPACIESILFKEKHCNTGSDQ
ncbi:hypothetical protein F2P56_035633 [Juglans regia]|uniref:Uncharacterized protein LOC108990663 n=2 Tax=Juglans regia TaxID=51240 RepID=A0A2I4ELF3_JUGRE|nr:uncharacterized protein LOC108990663 [Juglans regia]KAF5443038.1 hypothetical protein F2P56_035633 [Juglans regia]